MLDERLSAYFDIDVETLSSAYMLKKYLPSRSVCACLYALDKALLRLPTPAFCGESINTLTKR